MNDVVFKDAVVIITGASSGIGRELAYQLARQGARLALGARDAERLEEVAAECRASGAQVLVVPTDVGVQADCEALVQKTVATYQRVDMLVNNAGMSMWAFFDEITDLSIFERLMRVNYLGSVYCTHYALPYLKQSRGRVVGVSSLTGKSGVPTRTGYAASKHAMAGFFDSLRIELADSGVSVTMAYPGFVSTEVRERALRADGKPLGKSPVHEKDVMTVEVCSRLILEAAAKRRREVVMTWRGKLGVWLKLIAPGLVDKIARQGIESGR